MLDKKTEKKEEKKPEKKAHGPKPPKDVKVLTIKELHKTANERVHLIAKEFTNGFNFISRYPRSVTIFGGNRFTNTDEYYEKARSLGARIVNDLNYAVITGGGPGIMEAANRGAFEAGGESLGLTIELEHEQIQNQYLTESMDFYYFFSRKVCMSFCAETYVFFPGGYGTLDELFEIVTLVQTGKIQKLPIILFGSDFWNPFNELIKKELADRGLISRDEVNLYEITDDEDKVIEIIRNAPVRNGIEFTHKDLQRAGIKIEKVEM